MSEEKIVNVPFEMLVPFVTDVFKGMGVPAEEAAVCTDVLLEADRRGIESHGVNRLKPIYYDRVKIGIQKADTNFEIIKQTETTAVVDGHDGMGQVIGQRCMAMAIDMAKKHGLGMVAARNSTHYGIAGYYATMATDAGCVGITGTNARPSIAPTFGVENMMGTNPLTIGIPTDEPFPFCIDCATSIVQRGKIELYERLGKDTPAGQVIARDGSAMTDSPAVLKALVSGDAALAPLGGIGKEMGGHKGYGYAAAVELLSAALAGGNYLKMLTGIGPEGEKVPYHLGHFFLAINTEAFIGEAAFRKTAGEICRGLRASQKAAGETRIWTPGEHSYETKCERAVTGVPVNPAVQRELLSMRDELGLVQYKFPFED